ncbi:MarR family winged helix-turn-helix transcriptional regulator [uncultured Roseobacter sp.]|uniref:MarR family winged helix-turn-helix transcriptional regulator n=1 Tax=uncultured Roseobacter sp. TaxID=114847 RepID=UPI00262889B7|nr:MarR family winged helix-turn-helix transcriptional regulator [uncultured Roseobacter sp.]
MYLEKMTQSKNTGLGELLRHLTDLLDRGSQDAYRKAGLSYRPRYTPIMRALEGKAVSVTDLCGRMRITQGAVSQTIKLMEQDGLIKRVSTDDSRSRAVALTPAGSALQSRLAAQWELRLAAISDLEAEIGAPLRLILENAVQALERDGFAKRLARMQSDTDT